MFLHSEQNTSLYLNHNCGATNHACWEQFHLYLNRRKGIYNSNTANRDRYFSHNDFHDINHNYHTHHTDMRARWSSLQF
jgi:hypothetical protein